MKRNINKLIGNTPIIKLKIYMLSLNIIIMQEVLRIEWLIISLLNHMRMAF